MKSEWLDNGGSVGCESPDAGAVVEYQPDGQGGYVCSCTRHFISFAGFVKHIEEVGGAHHLHSALPKPLAADFVPPDPINHPPHYTFGKIEVISVIEDWGLSFHLAQVVKYVARSKHKGSELQDLKKAQFYLNRLITSLEK